MSAITSLSQLDLNGTYSYADYLAWIFEECVELIRGHIMQIVAPSRAHQRISGRLHTILNNMLWRSECQVYAAPFDVRLTRYSTKINSEITTVVQPDLSVICDPAKLDERGCIGAPDLIVEIVSPGNSRREMKDKFEVYQDAGVSEYWIVNPNERTVHIFQLDDQGIYVGLQPLIEDDILTTPVITGLQILLQEVFEQV